jgi:hypothetical protein
MNQPVTPEALAALTDVVIESMRLRKLSNRELIFEVAHSELADDPGVQEMMSRLWPEWPDTDCPSDCWACKQEMQQITKQSPSD